MVMGNFNKLKVLLVVGAVLVVVVGVGVGVWHLVGSRHNHDDCCVDCSKDVHDLQHKIVELDRKLNLATKSYVTLVTEFEKVVTNEFDRNRVKVKNVEDGMKNLAGVVGDHNKAVEDFKVVTAGIRSMENRIGSLVSQMASHGEELNKQRAELLKWKDRVRLLGALHNENWAGSKLDCPVFIGEDWTIDRLPKRLKMSSEDKQWFEKFLLVGKK